MITTEFYSEKQNPTANRVVGNFVSHVTFGRGGLLRDYCSMAVIRDRTLIAGVLFQEYYIGSGVIELSAASVDKRWMTRRVVHDMFSMPFSCLRANLVMVRTAEDNHPVRSISERTGLTRHYVPLIRGDGNGEYIYTMDRALWDSLPYSKVEAR